MPSVRHEVASGIRGLQEAHEDCPVTSAGPQGYATGLRQQGLDELQRISQRRGGIKNLGVSDYAQEAGENEPGYGEGFSI